MAKHGAENRLSALGERRVKLQELDQGQVQVGRLNTNMRLDYQKALEYRRVEGHGTKTEQLEEAVKIYLRMFDGRGGRLTQKQLSAMERVLEEDRG